MIIGFFIEVLLNVMAGVMLLFLVVFWVFLVVCIFRPPKHHQAVFPFTLFRH